MNPSPAPVPRAASFDGGLVTVPPALLASLGEQLAAMALRLQQEGGALSAPALGLLNELEQTGLELQELVHALGVVARTEEETVDLLQAAKAALSLWHAVLQQHGLRMQVQGDAAPAQLDPVLLQHALDLLVGHALAGAQDFCLLALPATAATPAGLRLSGLGAGAASDELHWHLLRMLARARGWRLSRHVPPDAPEGTAASQVVLLFGSPPAAPLNEGLPRMELASGMRVLVIDPNELSRVQCARLLGQAGVPCDCVASLAQAEDALQHGGASWTAVVSGFSLGDPAMQRLAEQLQERQGAPRWIELVDEAHAFVLGTPDGSRPARIARADLAHTLLPSLSS